MSLVLRIIAGIIILTALIAWVGTLSIATPNVRLGAALPTVSTPGQPDVARNIPTRGDIDATGTVHIDRSSGKPFVPYLVLIDAHRRMATKQLVFADVRACAPTAGDLPCAPSLSSSSGYPELIDGQKIRVLGEVRDDRLIVYELYTL